jgi:hypothetical protein
MRALFARRRPRALAACSAPRGILWPHRKPAPAAYCSRAQTSIRGLQWRKIHMADSDVSMAQVLTREERDRIGFANAIELSSDEDEVIPPQGSGAASSSSSAAANRVKFEGGGSSADLASSSSSSSAAAAAAAPQPKPPGNDLSADASFTEPVPLAKHPARLAGHVELKVHALKGTPGTAYHWNPVTQQPEWRSTPAPEWLCIGGGSRGVHASPSVQLASIVMAANRNDLRVDDGTRGRALLAALLRLSEPHNNTFYRPLVTVEISPPLPWSLAREGDAGRPLKARLDVYFEPTIFALRISAWRHPESFYHDVWQVMEGLTPVRAPIPTPRPPPVVGSSSLALSGGGADARRANGQGGRIDAFAFTTAGLMRAMESAGYAEMANPPGLLLSLYSYQRQTLQWMYDRETQPGGLNALFWEERPSHMGHARDPLEGSMAPADHTFYYNAMAGELRDERPPIVTGGFLCEEMGLGKSEQPAPLHPLPPPPPHRHRRVPL